MHQRDRERQQLVVKTRNETRRSKHTRLYAHAATSRGSGKRVTKVSFVWRSCLLVFRYFLMLLFTASYSWVSFSRPFRRHDLVQRATPRGVSVSMRYASMFFRFYASVSKCLLGHGQDGLRFSLSRPCFSRRQNTLHHALRRNVGLFSHSHFSGGCCFVSTIVKK